MELSPATHLYHQRCPDQTLSFCPCRRPAPRVDCKHLRMCFIAHVFLCCVFLSGPFNSLNYVGAEYTLGLPCLLGFLILLCPSVNPHCENNHPESWVGNSYAPPRARAFQTHPPTILPSSLSEEFTVGLKKITEPALLLQMTQDPVLRTCNCDPQRLQQPLAIMGIVFNTQR